MALRFLFQLVLLGALCLACGCSDWHYYHQSLSGHWHLVRRQQDIQTLLKDATTPEALKTQLRLALDIRAFASRELGLPDNASYRRYVDVGRPYAVWNLVATSEFALTPETWCYPVAGCLPYRGFYRRSDADRAARDLHRRGYDVTVYGVPAYSTLNWFADPLLSSFSQRPPEQLAAMIFHELAHQVVFIPGDGAFNEAFATSVEIEGVLRYLDATGGDARKSAYLLRHQREEDFVALLLDLRRQLQQVYATPLSPAAKRAEKLLAIRQAERRYADFKAEWGNFTGFDGWFRHPLNNARLASVATYHDQVPLLRQLFAQSGRDFPRFFALARRLGHLPTAQRAAALSELLRPAATQTARSDELPG